MLIYITTKIFDHRHQSLVSNADNVDLICKKYTMIKRVRGNFSVFASSLHFFFSHDTYTPKTNIEGNRRRGFAYSVICLEKKLTQNTDFAVYVCVLWYSPHRHASPCN